jgi:hypothetical protein
VVGGAPLAILRAVSAEPEPEPFSSTGLPARPAPIRHGNAWLALALLATLLLWNVPYGEYALYPFKLFATWLHESSHGLIMLLTGAGFDHMAVFRDTSGLAYPNHGVTPAAQAVISSAGYVGTGFFGALFLVLGRTPRGARVVLSAVAFCMLLTAALFIRNGFGVSVIVFGGLVMAILAWKSQEPAAAFTLHFLAAQSCINAVLDIRVLFGSSMIVNGQVQGRSDAHTMADTVGGPPVMWATIWLGWSFLMFFVALRYTRVKAQAAEVPAAATSPVQQGSLL